MCTVPGRDEKPSWSQKCRAFHLLAAYSILLSKKKVTISVLHRLLLVSSCAAVLLLALVCRRAVFSGGIMMTRSRPTICYFLVVTLCVVLKALSLTPFEACSDFEPTPGGPDVTWGLMDCIEVWKKWGATIDQSLHNGYQDREILKDLSAIMRRQGSPCTVREEKTLDGTGSSVMRHMAAWLYAKEVGCDWTTPDFNQGDVTKLLDPENLQSEEVLYCHRTEFVFKFNVSTPLKEGTEARRCSSVSWLHFFHLTEHSVPPPSDGVVKVVSVRRNPRTACM